MKSIITFALLLVICLTSCGDEAFLRHKERRLTGTWSIERVKFREDWALFRNDKFNFYSGDKITFYNDYTAVYEDNSLNEIFDGAWDMVLEFDGDDDRTAFVDMYFYDTVNNEEFSYYAEITFLTHNKLKMRVFTPDGRYRFKLLKE